MKEPGAHSFAEIMSQHESWRDAIAGARVQAEAMGSLLERYAAEPMLFVACGSP